MFGCFVRNVTHELTSSIIMPTLNNFTAHLNFTGIKHVCKANQQGGQGTGSNGQGCSIYNLFQWMKTSIGFARCDRVPIKKILNIYFLFCTKDIIQCYGLYYIVKVDIFYVFLIFFKIDPKYFPLRRSCRINRVFYRLP